MKMDKVANSGNDIGYDATKMYIDVSSIRYITHTTVGGHKYFVIGINGTSFTLTDESGKDLLCRMGLVEGWLDQMKHKMIGCSEECLRLACCDFCIYVRYEFFFDKDGDIVRGGPTGCGLHDDERHQDIAESCGHCPDFHCFRADEDNMVVKVIDDEMA